MTEVVVVFPPGAVEAANDAVRAVLESHMAGFTDTARRQFVKRVAKLLREAAERPKGRDPPTGEARRRTLRAVPANGARRGLPAHRRPTMGCTGSSA